MQPILLIDFGSTYTKVTGVDADAAEVLGTASSHTTVAEDISIGLDNAMALLRAQTGEIEYSRRYACSSAAGGLRMIASGLVPSLTAEAAKRAALGAGAKVVKTYSFQLTDDDAAEIAALKPDILLLVGGTDGGNAECIEHNARVIAGMALDFPVVLAGNRASAKKCEAALAAAGREVHICENVMPTFNKLNIEPAQAVIREVFLKRIIAAKGLSKAQELIDGIMMPTPAAVLSALTLLAEDMGELMAVDLGGATTDIYSITAGLPTRAGTMLRGLPEPYAKRTVEGDIGMRYSARGVVEAAGMEKVAAVAGQSAEAVEAWLARIDKSPDVLPQAEAERDIDFALASLAIELGLLRHAGTLEQLFTPMGIAYQQTGKDLTRISQLILTGGALIHARPELAVKMAERAMETGDCPSSLMPRKAGVLIDSRYILSAMGLLSVHHPELARKMMKKEFDRHGVTQ